MEVVKKTKASRKEINCLWISRMWTVLFPSRHGVQKSSYPTASGDRAAV